ncbi:MAG TPA: hypothetical protein VMM37_07465, partial [Bacteroidota bacterium]|nr:hypothetical protein [Bacteroidota bacterium]
MSDGESPHRVGIGSPSPEERPTLDAVVARSGIPPSKFLPLFRRELASVPDPERALNNFLRFVSTGFTSSLLSGFLGDPRSLSVALTLFGHSQYLADILVRNPELFHWLMSPNVRAGSPGRDELLREARLAVAPFERIEKKMDALKRFQRREILRISARDILEEAEVTAVTAELSRLADAIVETVAAVAFEDLNTRLSANITPVFSVIGLGKLGGEELNFSSDIDLMFVYDEDGDLDF